jgi:hypothetical protein
VALTLVAAMLLCRGKKNGVGLNKVVITEFKNNQDEIYNPVKENPTSSTVNEIMVDDVHVDDFLAAPQQEPEIE